MALDRNIPPGLDRRDGCGVLNGSIGLAGPPVVSYHLAGADTPRAMRASFTVFFAWVDAIAMVSYAVAGKVGHRALLLGLELAVPYLVCAGAGVRPFRVSHEGRYRLIATGVLFGVALSTLPV